MTNAMGRRPDGPGNDEVLYNGTCEADSDREVTLYRDGTIEIIDHYSGMFMAVRVPDGVLHPPVAAPEPDWSQAPQWAMWWTVDADGAAHWWENEPVVDNGMWIHLERGEWAEDDTHCHDWEETLRKRPEVGDE